MQALSSAPARVASHSVVCGRFKLGQHVLAGQCRRLLGLMVAASPGSSLGAAPYETIPLVDESPWGFVPLGRPFAY